MTNKSGVSEQIISLPKGGGELKGLGENFQPDLHTGTGNFSVPISIPPGRNGFQPSLTLSYSTGSGNGPFGFGWAVGIPTISRKTSMGMPKYQDIFNGQTGDPMWHEQEDVFVMSGADDLVYVGDGKYRPRTEGLFSRIERAKSEDGMFCWIVTDKGGSRNTYGKDLNSCLFSEIEINIRRVSHWFLSETEDVFGNKIIYRYKRDRGENNFGSEIKNDDNESILSQEINHEYNQLYLHSIEYVNYSDPSVENAEKYLFKIDFDYGEFDNEVKRGNPNLPYEVRKWDIRPDGFSSYRTGFEIRTARRCRRILIRRRVEGPKDGYELIKSYELQYNQDAYTGVSLLREVKLKGFKDGESEDFPPIIFGYTKFEPENRKYENLYAEKGYLPERALNDPNYEIIDLFGNGLPSIVNSSPDGWRYWRNLGNGSFAYPKSMKTSPAGVLLSNAGVQFADMNGDGSVELLVTASGASSTFAASNSYNTDGYYEKDSRTGNWSKFVKYRQAPAFDLKDVNVKLVDMNGDGVVDVLCTFDNYFLFIRNINDEKELRFDRPIRINRKHDLDHWPDVYLGSPDQRVRLADISGDGLQDIVFVHSGRIDYWPNLGNGKFGKRITMRDTPMFKSRSGSGIANGYNPANLFLTDVNGDGLADLVFVDYGIIHLWINKSGNGWSDEIIIRGTPSPTNVDSVRIADMKGTGVSGVLWSYDFRFQGRGSDNNGHRRGNYKYLDFTGGIKPLLLNTINNNIGAITIVEYQSSINYYLNDQRNGHPWKTTLPFSVQVVSKVKKIDAISQGYLTSEFFYHHGYWDGLEREFRGFGRVDQRDSEVFDDYITSRSNSLLLAFSKYKNETSIDELSSKNNNITIDKNSYSPPTETRTWFHQGVVRENSGNYIEIDYSDEFSSKDKPRLVRPAKMTDFISTLPPDARRQALKSPKGQILRSELYALDDSGLQDEPYKVTEYLIGIYAIPSSDHLTSLVDDLPSNIFFPPLLAERVTHWERGIEPMTRFKFIGDHDMYGQPRSEIKIAVPRGRNYEISEDANEPYIVTHTVTTYSQAETEEVYIVNRPSSVTTYEILNDGKSSVFALHSTIEHEKINRRVIGQILNFYDGPAFDGLPFHTVGKLGALVRTERLVFTEEILREAYRVSNSKIRIPPYFSSAKGNVQWTEEYPQDFRLSLQDLAGYLYRQKGIYYSLTRNWGSKGNGDDQFRSPNDIAIDPRTGEVVISDTDNDRIQKFDSKGNFIQTIGESELTKPIGIAIDPLNSDIYVGEPKNNTIRKFSTTGEFIKMWQIKDAQIQDTLKGSLAVDSSGNVYIADWGHNRIQKFSRSGSFIKMWGKQGTGAGEFQNPTGIDIDTSGNVYVIDKNALQIFKNDGMFISRVSRNGSKPLWGVAVDTSGNTYETLKHKVQKWTSDNSGVVYQWGSAGSGDSQFGEGTTQTGPRGIDINNSTGEVYVVDTVNNRIQVFAPEPKTGYFAITERRKYDFHDGNKSGKDRGLIKVKKDSLGNTTEITYDDFGLMSITIKDSANLATQARYDYRVMQPKEIIDSNGNRTRYIFNSIGLLEKIYVLGKEEENLGDIQRESISYKYDLLSFQSRNEPISVSTTQRIFHDSDTVGTNLDKDETLKTIEYSDGFGRLIQTRTQGPNRIFTNDLLSMDFMFGNSVLPHDLQQAGAIRENLFNPSLVAVSGWQIHDNKGRIIKKYEPLFSKGWDYETPKEDQKARNTVYLYDAIGRTIRTINPDNSEQLTVYGRPLNLEKPELFIPNPWETFFYDSNDNGGRTHPSSSLEYEKHWNTPSSMEVDALGREIINVVRNGPDKNNDWYTTTKKYDISGNILTIIDVLGRNAVKYIYDFEDRALSSIQLDGGTHWMAMDANGNLIEQRDSKGALILRTFDLLNRPEKSWVKDKMEDIIGLSEVLIYGDDEKNSGLSRIQAVKSNLLGKLFKHYDEAGVLIFRTYDFKSNIVAKTRRVVKDSIMLSVFATSTTNWQSKFFRTNWQMQGETSLQERALNLLDNFDYDTNVSYDALNRIRTIRYPQDVTGTRMLLSLCYNPAGMLDRVELGNNGGGTAKPYVEHISYNARGQRTLILYGNGIMTRYAYERETFRLKRMRTERYHVIKTTSLTYSPTGSKRDLHQDLAYSYDLCGNIILLQDRTPDSGTPIQPDKLDRIFKYDPLYRLLSSTGRESKSMVTSPDLWNPSPKSNDPTLTRAYIEEYSYDAPGNILRVNHYANQGNGSYTRSFILNPDNNRLKTVVAGSGSVSYSYLYNENGNIIKETNSRHFEWDHSNRLKAFKIQQIDAEPTIHVSYLYDTAGNRIKKLVRKPGGYVETTVYIDDILEHHAITTGGKRIENNSIHVMEGKKRISLIRVGPPIIKDYTPSEKYHIGDHLGSSSIVLDGNGNPINREEYTSYGETSFGSFERKRYRFTGKERDEESGLYYHTARYYAPWLARWTSCDPGGFEDGFNLYRYSRNNPMRFIDPGGTQSIESRIESIESPAGWLVAKTAYDIWNVVSLGTLSKVESQKNLGTIEGVGESAFNAARTVSNTASFGLQDRIFEAQMSEGPGAESIARGVIQAGADLLPIAEADILADPDAPSAEKWKAAALAVSKTATMVAAGLRVTGKAITVPKQKGAGTHQESRSLKEVSAKWEARAIRGKLRKTEVEKQVKQRRDWEKEKGKLDKQYEVDHTVDKQLGGALRDIENMAPLDKSFNRSAGPRLYWQIKSHRVGQRYDRVIPEGERVPFDDVSGIPVVNQMANNMDYR